MTTNEVPSTTTRFYYKRLYSAILDFAGAVTLPDDMDYSTERILLSMFAGVLKAGINDRTHERGLLYDDASGGTPSYSDY